MRFAAIVEASTLAAATRSRLAKRDAIATCLRDASGDEVAVAVAFLAGEIRQGRIGIGPAMLRSLRGNAATESMLSVAEVDAAFDRIVATTGKGSAGLRAKQLGELFARALPAEQDFLVRLLIGELRQGALEGVMIEAIAAASGAPAADVRRAVMFSGDLGLVAHAAATGGAAALMPFSIELMRPVQPMLAQPAADIADALERLGTTALEWKLDGARVQVHKSGGEVRVFTRNLNDVTVAVPEIVEIVGALDADRLILDGEAIALTAGGAPQPFQITMRRFGRKLDIERLRAELPMAVFFFDCLHSGEPLVDRTTQERFTELTRVAGSSLVIPRLVTGDLAAGEDFYADALARGHEGVMAKALDTPYEAGGRGGSWLKVKRAHTLDLVVLAAEWGNGRRQGWLSNLHLGARDPDNGGFVMLGKTFKGMTDQLLEWQTRELLLRADERGDYTVYVRPELVVEIAFNDLQASTQYPGGLALRFARVKGYRPDKDATDADTIDTVRAIYAAQTGRGD